jgi:hypothetical protein
LPKSLTLIILLLVLFLLQQMSFPLWVNAPHQQQHNLPPPAQLPFSLALGHSSAVTSASDLQSSSRSDAATSAFFNQKNDKQPGFLLSNTTTHYPFHHHRAPQQDLNGPQMIWPSILQPPHVPLQQQQALVRSKVKQHETENKAAVVHHQKHHQQQGTKRRAPVPPPAAAVVQENFSLICSLIPDEQKFQELMRERRYEKREFEEF